MSKRELLARGLFWGGAPLFLNLLPERNVLLVLNYHRLGNPEEDLYDPGVFSATADEFNEQVAYLRRHVSLVTLEEAAAFVEGKAEGGGRRFRVLLTFDDGYLDNYRIAFPILRSHGVQGVFFLPTAIVGSSQVPWWDHIAFLMRTTRERRFRLGYPAGLEIDLDRDGFRKSLDNVLRLYKSPENVDSARFLEDLTNAVNGTGLPPVERRFLDWGEAREMIEGGMAIGSHTHTHTILSQLPPEQQEQELVQSRRLLRERLGIEADSLSYPVGATSSFSETTQRLAKKAGYRVAFSFYSGTNASGDVPAYDVKRVGVGSQSRLRFRLQAAMCRATGQYWP